MQDVSSNQQTLQIKMLNYENFAISSGAKVELVWGPLIFPGARAGLKQSPKIGQLHTLKSLQLSRLFLLKTSLLCQSSQDFIRLIMASALLRNSSSLIFEACFDIGDHTFP